MGSFMQKCDGENIRMEMLKQEETFREQVKELHRLYRVQKLLMSDVKSSELKRHCGSVDYSSNLKRWSGNNKACYDQRVHGKLRMLDLELPAEEYIEENEGNIHTEQESDVELTLAVGGSWRKKEDTSDSGASFSSSSTESGVTNMKFHRWSSVKMPDINASSSDERRPVMQDRLEQPSWYFQCLSLNMA